MVASKAVSEVDIPRLAELMIGDSTPPAQVSRTPVEDRGPVLEIRNLTVRGDHGLAAVKDVSLTVHTGEILGIAGVSGNGQRELVQAMGGQRPIELGEVRAFGAHFDGSRKAIFETGLFTLPEEPLENATVPGMSVAENLALRTFDRAPLARGGFLLDRGAMCQAAEAAISRFAIRTRSPWNAMRDLSGGNVQRAVLARDLGANHARVLVVANPCFGLDFAATAFVHNQLVELRNSGGAVLLVSEDLDELLKLADRIVIMSGGEVAHETLRADVDLALVGRFMGGHGSR
jgi:simple sugar transport system ATP-binding protein